MRLNASSGRILAILAVALVTGGLAAAAASGDAARGTGTRLARWVTGSGGIQNRDGAGGPNGIQATVGQAAVGDVFVGTSRTGAFGFWPRGSAVVDVEDASPSAPARTALRQNRPNPFNPRTTIGFDLAAAGRVTIRVFDVSGRQIATVLDADLPAGSHEAVFAPAHLPSGVYFYELRHGSSRIVRSLTLLK